MVTKYLLLTTDASIIFASQRARRKMYGTHYKVTVDKVTENVFWSCFVEIIKKLCKAYIFLSILPRLTFKITSFMSGFISSNCYDFLVALVTAAKVPDF